MSDSESVNDNEGNEPSKETAFNSHWETDDESETSLKEIIPFNSHPEASDDEGDEPTVEITFLNSGRKASDDIFIGSSSRTFSLAVSEDQPHLKKKINQSIRNLSN
ncbi:hypothetical protein C2G38_2047131 [Gigaspora rosea]|uniref:Uncharacterized protein n=1 Tax=Gigaspora rosea TaxID=44941 RepID=A0A397UAD2_9GLOM|nr:hypothetical protein C2G38_2047131 [Gigaspora rosea]